MEYVAPTITLGIGGVRTRYEAAEPDLMICVSFPHTRFVMKDELRPDCIVRVRLGDAEPGSPPTFISGGPWEVHKGEHGGDRLAIWTSLGGGRREAMIRVDLSPALDHGEMSVHPRYAPGRTVRIGYPLDEYLTARMLARRGGIVVHASAVAEQGGGAYVFAGHSGAGKSTIASIAEQNGLRVLSDDRTVLSVQDGVVVAAGTPWHGSHASGSPDAVRVLGIFLLEQAAINQATTMPKDRAFSELMVRTVRPMAEPAEHVAVVNVVEQVVGAISAAVLRFRPDASALGAVRYFLTQHC